MTNLKMEMDDRLLRMNLLLTQGILMALSAFLSWRLFRFSNLSYVLVYPTVFYVILAGGFAFFIVLINCLIDRFLPSKWVEEDEVNEKIFLHISVFQTLLLCLLIGISEEWLFRGVLQLAIGNLFTSALFTLLHIRYLRKPVLMLFVFMTSYMLGLLFEASGSLLTTIFAHITIDFILALLLRRESSRKSANPISIEEDDLIE